MKQTIGSERKHECLFSSSSNCVCGGYTVFYVVRSSGRNVHGFRSIIQLLMIRFFKKIIWYLTMNKIEIEFAKKGYSSIWPEVMAPDRLEKLQMFGFRSNIQV